MTAQVCAAGAVLCSGFDRDGTGDVRIALVHRPRYDDWSLPKGKVRAGETIAAAAVRELAEETGSAAVLGRKLGTVEYAVGSEVSKRVTYFAATARGGEFSASDEVDELRWLDPHDAAHVTSYQGDRDVLRRFTELGAIPLTALLVRHAKAGDRAEWANLGMPDDLRPLSSHGREQAAALRKLLPCFGPTSVYAAPPLRCVQSVEGTAADIGTEIRMEQLLSEAGCGTRPDAALMRLLAIVAGDSSGHDGPADRASPAVPLVSSQGGAIPFLVDALARRAAFDLPVIRSAKGSLWVLSFNRGNTEPSLVAADYYPTPYT